MADSNTNINEVRSLVADVTTDINGEYLFPDDQITNFLTLAENDPRRAAGYALLALATDQAYTLKHISTDDLGVQGDMVAAQLLAIGKQWINEANNNDFGMQLVF